MFKLEEHLDTVRAVARTCYGARLSRAGIDVDDFVADLVVKLVIKQDHPRHRFHPRDDEALSQYGSPRRFWAYVMMLAAPMARDEIRKATYRRGRSADLAAWSACRTPVDESARLEAREELRRTRC